MLLIKTITNNNSMYINNFKKCIITTNLLNYDLPDIHFEKKNKK